MLNKTLAWLLPLTLCCCSCNNISNNSTPAQKPTTLPTSMGVAVLCNQGTGSIQASIIVTNLVTLNAKQSYVPVNSTAADVCAAINSAATSGPVGLSTDYNTGANLTGVTIYGDPTKIRIQCVNIPLQLERFTPAAPASTTTGCDPASSPLATLHGPAATPLPCPPITPECKSVSVSIDPVDPSKGTFSISLNLPLVELEMMHAAQSAVNANLPPEFTKIYNFGLTEFRGGKVTLHQVLISPDPSPNTLDLQIADDCQKELWQNNPFPIFHPVGWQFKELQTVGRASAFGDVTFSVDKLAALPMQQLIVTARQDHVAGTVTIGNSHIPLSFSLHNRTYVIALPILSADQAAQNGLQGLALTSISFVSTDPSTLTLTGNIGPAPVTAPAHYHHPTKP